MSNKLLVYRPILAAARPNFFGACAFHARLPVMMIKRGGYGLSHGRMGWSYVYLRLRPTSLRHAFRDCAGVEIVKPWFGCVVAEHATVCDAFSDFSAGTLDGE